MDDAERIGVLGTGQEAADGAAVLDLLEPRAVGRGKTGRFSELAKAWRNGHGHCRPPVTSPRNDGDLVARSAGGVTGTRNDGR